MMTNTYQPGSSAVHLFDPRAKLISLLAFVIALFLPVRVVAFAPYIAALCGLIVLSLRFRELALPILTILPILILVLLLTPPFHRTGTVLIRFFGWTYLTTGGLTEAMRMICRFSGITLAFFLYFRTTDLDSFILALRWFGLPFRAALVATLAFRYIPFMFDLYGNIVDAHKLRLPAESKPRRGFGRLVELMPVLTSVLIQAVKSIPTLSMALEMRGIGRSETRTSLREMKKGANLLIHFVAAAALVALIYGPLLSLPSASLR